MNHFHLLIVTPDGVSFDGKAKSLLVRTSAGDVEILAGHTDFIATIDLGIARLTDCDGKIREASVQGGFLTVKNGEVTMTNITFEFSDEIDLVRAEKAKTEAEDALREATDEKAQRIAEARLTRALNRISVADRRR